MKCPCKDRVPYPGAHFVRILDPWHVDAFVGTPAEGLVLPGHEGKRVWVCGIEDWVGNMIGERGICLDQKEVAEMKREVRT